MKRLLLPVLLAAACAKTLPPPRAPEPAPAPKEEPAPVVQKDDGMQLEGQLGSIPDEDINRAFREHWPDVARCSTLAQTHLAYLHGTIELKVRVGKEGTPINAYVERSSLGNYDAERCVLEVARALTFPAPKGGSEAEFSFPIEVKSKRGTVVAWEEARIAPTAERSRRDAGVCRGDPPVVKAKGRKKHARKVVAAVPKVLPANLSLTVYIAPGGKVSSAGLAGEGPIDETFASCLLARARTWQVDDPRGTIAKATIGIQ